MHLPGKINIRGMFLISTQLHPSHASPDPLSSQTEADHNLEYFVCFPCHNPPAPVIPSPVSSSFLFPFHSPCRIFPSVSFNLCFPLSPTILIFSRLTIRISSQQLFYFQSSQLPLQSHIFLLFPSFSSSLFTFTPFSLVFLYLSPISLSPTIFSYLSLLSFGLVSCFSFIL